MAEKEHSNSDSGAGAGAGAGAQCWETDVWEVRKIVKRKVRLQMNKQG